MTELFLQDLLIPKTQCPHEITDDTDIPDFYRAKTWSVVRRCTYPSIHFFVSRSRSVVDCALCGVVWYVWCEGLVVCVDMVVRM